MSDLTAALDRIAAAPEGPGTAAFFDFDGTIIDGYSAMAVLQHRLRHFDMKPDELGRMVWSGVQAGRGGGFAHFMRQAVKELEGTSQEEFDKLGASLLKNTLGGSLFPEMWDLVRAHRKAGHTVAIASSAMPFQIEPLVREMGVDNVLCTRLEMKDGVATGEIDGEVVWGHGKAKAVLDFAADNSLDLTQAFAYGNGDEDVDYLAGVGHPTAVNPADKLEQVAVTRHWPVLRFGGRSRPSLMSAGRTVAAYTGLATAFGVSCGIGLLNRSRRDAVNLTLSVGSDVYFGLAGIDVRVIGEEHLWEHRPAVFIFNHQSLLDPVVAAKLIREDTTAVGKKEVARRPGLAQFAWLANAALVDRQNSAKAIEAMRPIVDRLKDGWSIILAPEGTRSTTPKMNRFKKGAFHVAMQAGVPIVPIVIRNSGELLWRGSTFVRSGTLDVAVLPPISVEDWTVDELDDRVAEVQAKFQQTLDDWPV